MDRLTIYHEDGNEIKGVEGKTCKEICRKQIECNNCPIENVINKLAEYEELEEKGLLVRLPFKVGDKAYCVGSKCLSGLYEEICEQVSLVDECDICPLESSYIVFEREVTADLLAVLVTNKNELFIMDKTVFKTRAEAEAALALRVRR